MTSQASSYERRQAYLEAELAANLRPGNGRAEVFNQIVRLELGAERDYGSFERFVEAIRAAPVRCEGLSVRYGSPSLGEVRFGWTGPLRVGEREIALSGYWRFDNPYCRAEVGERRYVVSYDAEELVLDLQ